MIKLIPIGLLFFALQQTKAQSLDVYVNDSIFITEPLLLSQTDTVNGKAKYVYANHNNALAYEVNFYNGYRTGLVKYYYPTGQLMSTCVYQKSKKNGEYTLYDKEGKIVIKGVYWNNIKEEFWMYKKYGFYGDYKGGLKHRKWRYLLPNGNKQTLVFKKGVLIESKTGLPPVPKYILMDGVLKL